MEATLHKRYCSYSDFFREKFGARVQKLVVDAGFTCPNRDGSLGYGGCSFCDNRAFHPGYSTPEKSIATQLDEGIEFHRRRYRRSCGYLAYFQPHTNTYAPLERLRSLYSEALSHPEVTGIVIGTRPDCVDSGVLELLKELSKDKFVIVEYGSESCYDRTLRRVNRGHSWQQAVDAVRATAEAGLMQGAHFILGLPGESRDDMLAYADAINSLPLDTVKFHQLQIIRGTAMEAEYERSPEDFVTWTLDEYIDFFIDILERLRPDLYIERFAGEVPPRFVKSTPWGLVRNYDIIARMEKLLEERDSRQGKLYNTQI